MKRHTVLLTCTFAIAAAAASAVVTGPPATASGWEYERPVVAGALAVLREHAVPLGFAGDHAGPQGLGRDYRVRVTDVMGDGDGSTHVRLERSYAGLPVLGGDFIVHRDAAGHWLGASATFVRPLTALGLQPGLDARSAVRRAVPPTAHVVGTPRLVIDARRGPAALTWDVESVGRAPNGTPSHLHTYLDASTGAVRSRNELIENVAGTGHSLYGGDVPLETSTTEGLYTLRDATRGGTYTVDAAGGTESCSPEVLVCASEPTSWFTSRVNDWGDGTAANRASAAVDAQYGADMAWDFYRNVFKRSGLNNDGRGVYSRVHFGTDFANAFWSNECFCVTYGDGDGRTFGPLVSLDIAGHEITHGLTARTAGLDSEGESGGLNEATSDIFGKMIEFYANNPANPGNYLMGAQVFLQPRSHGRRNAIRYLDRPSKDGFSPDCWSPQVRALDIHLAAGVGNHFFYLLAEGSGRRRINGIGYDSPTCNGERLSGIGRDAAAAIWYRALTHYFTSATDYPAARGCAVRAATDLYGAGSTEVAAVNAAWDAVAVPGLADPAVDRER